MAFRVRKRELNHSPMWYREHCCDEDGGSAAFRAMFNADMKHIEAADDEEQTYLERIDLYEVAWNGATDANILGDIEAVMLREKRVGFVPQVEYAKGPFRSIARIMDKHEVSTTEVAAFLKWKAKNDNVAKARAAKKPTAKQVKEVAWRKQRDALFGGKKWKPPSKGGF